MSRVNAHVLTELERLQAEWDAGMVEGYAANVNMTPAWWHDTPPHRMTRRQRGYFFGRTVRLIERDEGIIQPTPHDACGCPCGACAYCDSKPMPWGRGQA